MSDLITSLRALSAARHDDLSIAVDAVIEIEKLRAEIARLHRAHQAACEGGDLLRAEVNLLRNALAPLAELYLWPDDLGDETARLIRSDDDWDEATNEDADSDVFIKRKHIRAARHALAIKPEMKEDGR
jgi:hypothetical protein